MSFVEEGEDVYITETVYHKETGQPCRQITTLNGLRHAPPDGSPSLVAYDEQGRATHMRWHAFDKEHRTEGPSSIVLFPETGIHMTEAFEIEGEPRPPELGPYIVRRDRTGQVRKVEAKPDWDQLSKPQSLEP